MKPSNCKHDRKDLVLHFYGELSEAAAADVDVRLKVCSVCEEYYTELISMEAIIPRSPSVEPDETVMAAIRVATARRLHEREGRQSRRLEPHGFVLPGPIRSRLSLVTALVVLAFFGGRYSTSFNQTGGTVFDAPSIADISDIAYDAETGTVHVQYRTVGVSSIEGSFEDDRVRSLVQFALVNADNPSTRLRAVKLLNMMNVEQIRPDADLVSALAVILKEDPNSGMKLQAIGALRRIHEGTALGGQLTELLMGVLDSSDNSALRIEALELLTASELTRQDLNRVLARASRDENSFVRFRARAALDDMPLDDIPQDDMQGTIPLDQLR